LAKKLGAEIAEIKINDMLKWMRYKNIPKERLVSALIPEHPPLPLILTFLRKEEEHPLGFYISKKEWEYVCNIFEECLDKSQIDFADIEIDTPPKYRDRLIKKVRESDIALIVSKHFYDRTPLLPALEKIYKEEKNLGADIKKIVPYNLTLHDAKITFELALHHKGEGIAIWGMGKAGILTRLNPHLSMSFAAFDDSSAEGQMPLSFMVKFKRYYQKHSQFRNFFKDLIFGMYDVEI
jgi:3-dehydroquinate dehydratase type I